MRVSATTGAPRDGDADTVAIGVFEGKGIPHDLDGEPLGALLASGEARAKPRHLALAHAEGKRWLLVGCGSRDAFGAEEARVAAATVAARCTELATRTLCWELPHKVPDAVVGGLVEGTLMAAHAVDPAAADGSALSELVVSAHHDVAGLVADAGVVAEAVNRCRRLGDAPPNVMTPLALAGRARELADEHGLDCEVLGREQLRALGYGLFAAVAQGSAQEPQLIALRYDGPEAAGPVLGLVGKGVTFDGGGLQIKPGASMVGMKYDMTTAAAVLEAVGAIAALGLPVRVVAVLGATENVLGPAAMRPGDVLRAGDGTTVEITNTDAEGRLVLADCLLHARAMGAERLLDLGTLYGPAVLGRTHAALFDTDAAWGAAVLAACERAGDDAWPMPLHPDHEKLLESRVADVVNSPDPRHALQAAAATFLKRFAGDVPWAHLDTAATYDRRRPYASKGASGWGVRAIVELARSL